MSIRWRLTLWYGGVLAVLLVAFSVTIFVIMQHQSLQRIDQGLSEELADVLGEIHRADDTVALHGWLERRFGGHQGFDFQIKTLDGQEFFVSPRLADVTLPGPKGDKEIAKPSFRTVSLDKQERMRVIRVTANGPDGPLLTQVTRSMEFHDHELTELFVVLLFSVPVTVLVAIGGGYFLARRALAPVAVMTTTANHITADRLDKRIAVTNDSDELGQLAFTLNGMIERLHRAISETRRFTADAAHELRTPLAVIRNEAEVALRSSRSEDEYRHVLMNVLEEARRLSTMAEQLLNLCRHDAGLQESKREVIEIGELIDDVVENMTVVASGKAVTVTLDRGDLPVIRGDRQQLRSLFYNLLDNAIKFTPASGAISVVCGVKNSEVSIVVGDTGIGISEEHISKVFDRFYRVDASRSGDENGSGLGLAICQSVVHSLNGTIDITSSIGAGTTVVVRLPVLASDGGSANKGNSEAR